MACGRRVVWHAMRLVASGGRTARPKTNSGALTQPHRPRAKSVGFHSAAVRCAVARLGIRAYAVRCDGNANANRASVRGWDHRAALPLRHAMPRGIPRRPVVPDHAPRVHEPTHTHARTRTHARTHARTRTHARMDTRTSHRKLCRCLHALGAHWDETAPMRFYGVAALRRSRMHSLSPPPQLRVRP
jgi:hypothetical protein